LFPVGLCLKSSEPWQHAYKAASES
jgi:hypothetical protein